MICLNDKELIRSQVGHNFSTTDLAYLLVIEELVEVEIFHGMLA